MTDEQAMYMVKINQALRNTMATLPVHEVAKIEDTLAQLHDLLNRAGDAGQIAYALLQSEFDNSQSPYQGHFDMMTVPMGDGAEIVLESSNG